VLVTGDLVHDPVTRAYERLLEKLLLLKAPVFCILGNHDHPDLMHRILNTENISTSKVLEAKQWVILLLDSFSANTHAGRLHERELRFLQQELTRTTDKHVFICLHHPPVSIDSPWMDAMMLENPDDLFAVVDKFNHVRGILWGHIHQEFSSERNKVLLFASPSTCVQFTPQATEYMKDNQPPGFREIRLGSNGSIKTEVLRVKVNQS